jgi:ABC-type siderophore export system fused ATPase/permease subunit
MKTMANNLTVTTKTQLTLYRLLLLMITGVSILTCYCRLHRTGSKDRLTFSIIILFLKSSLSNNMKKLTIKMAFPLRTIIKEQI